VHRAPFPSGPQRLCGPSCRRRGGWRPAAARLVAVGGWLVAAGGWFPQVRCDAATTYVDPFAAAAPSRVRGVAEGAPGDRLSEPAGPAAATIVPATFEPPPAPRPTDAAVLADAAPASAAEAPPSRAQPVVGGEILARVDGEVVLSSDVLWQVNQLIAANRDRIPAGELEVVRQMLTRQQVMGLIDTKLLYADFRRKVPAENLPKVEESLEEPFEDVEIPRLMKLMEVENRSQLEALLKQRGTSLPGIKRQFVEKTIAGEWLRQLTPKSKPITHEAMLAYYREHERNYRYEATVKYEELMVRFDRFPDRASAWRELADMGNQVWQQASAKAGVRGAVFADLARERSQGFSASDGGSHQITLGSLQCAALNEALETLAVGQMSDGIESPLGFHIVRVLERTSAGQRAFTEVQGEIRERLEQEQREQSVQTEIEQLRRNARVWTQFDGELSGPRLSEVLDGARRR